MSKVTSPGFGIGAVSMSAILNEDCEKVNSSENHKTKKYVLALELIESVVELCCAFKY